ncbi:MAG: 2-hydroxyacyl-CoA dehydratase family protein, partial [Acidobacteriota bacterium]
MNLALIFSDAAAGIERALGAAAPGDLTARKRFALHAARHGERLFAGREPLAMCGVLAPFELLAAAGVTAAYAEFMVASLAGTGDAAPLIDAAQQLGYPTDACTYHRAAFGLMRSGLAPVPDVLIATSAPCTGGVALIEELARHYRKPLFVLHLPQRQDEAAVRHVAGQLESLLEFLGRHLGRRPGARELHRAIEQANQARELL